MLIVTNHEIHEETYFIIHPVLVCISCELSLLYKIELTFCAVSNIFGKFAQTVWDYVL